MKQILFLCLFSFLISLKVDATVHPKFVDSKALFLIQSVVSRTDIDAGNLYKSLKVSPIKNGIQLEKKIEVKSGLERLFYIECSVMYTDVTKGSCNIHVYKSSFTELDPKRGYVYFDMAGGLSREIGEKFQLKNNGEIFISKDRSFSIRVNLSGDKATDFYITYNKK
ncbi:MAG: hypothetical protein ACJAS4_002135 [Bacteriovoracaceae bacterium]|jgi:hypothetical protein